MKEQRGKRMIVGLDIDVEATAADIFPLLCPVREYDWIDGWQCEVIFAASGAAENNCIFETDRPGEGRRVWVVSRYEPPKAIEFVIFQQDLAVVRLDLYLSENVDGPTRVRGTHTITALNDAGMAVVAHLDPDQIRSRWRQLAASMNHYLKTGKMLTEGR